MTTKLSSYEKLNSISLAAEHLSNTDVSNRVNEKYIEKKIKRIGTFCSEYAIDNISILDDQISPLIKIFYNIVQSENNGGNYIEGTRNLRHFSRGLDRSVDSYPAIIYTNYLESALEILSNNWRDSYLTGIISCLLRNWSVLTTKYTKNYRVLINFIYSKLSNYSGKRKLFHFIKNNNEYFFSTNGPVQFSMVLASGDNDIFTELKNLNCPKSIINFNYFDELLISYISAQKKNIYMDTDVINKILVSRSSMDIKRILCSKYINNFSIKDTIKNIALQQIGDPQISNYWLIGNDNYKKYQTEVNRAKDTLNIWINSEIIEIFFDQLSVYYERKTFWKKYIKVIPNIKIAGNSDLKRKFKEDERLKDFIDSRFIVANGGAPVLLFNVNNYLLVEYSEHGNAFYAYTSNREKYNLFFKTKVHNTFAFKQTSLPIIKSFEREGRFIHYNSGRNLWQYNMKRWLSSVVGIDYD